MHFALAWWWNFYSSTQSWLGFFSMCYPCSVLSSGVLRLSMITVRSHIWDLVWVFGAVCTSAVKDLHLNVCYNIVRIAYYEMNVLLCNIVCTAYYGMNACLCLQKYWICLNTVRDYCNSKETGNYFLCNVVCDCYLWVRSEYVVAPLILGSPIMPTTC